MKFWRMTLMAATLLLGCTTSVPGAVGPSTTPNPLTSLQGTTSGPSPSSTLAASTGCVGDVMTLDDRVAMLVIGLGSQQALETLDADLVGGVVLVGTADEGVGAVLDGLTAGRELPLLTMVDEEGGVVQRLASIIGEVPSARSMADEGSAAETTALMAAHAEKLIDLGFNVNLAPVVDVGGGPGIESRSYSADPSIVSEFASAAIDGLVEGGVVPVIKHFPGHGLADADSHERLPLAPPIDELRDRDLIPFAELIATYGTDIAVMVGHLDVPGLTTDGIPTSMSPEAIDRLLRGELGFDGVVMTDSLQMGAVSARWTEPEAAEQSILAGADMAMVAVEQVPATHARLKGLVEDGTLPEEQLDRKAARVLDLAGLDPCA